MKKILTHWATAFITLFIMTYIGLQDPWVKEVLRLKSFDYLLANEEKSKSQDITIITIDEEAIEKYGQWPWPRNKLADLIVNLRSAQTGDDHSIDIDVDGRTSDGSSIYITQTGNNRSYSGNLYCAHSFCTMTVTQP